MPITFANVLPLQQRNLGVGKETTPGTYVPPVNFLPIQEFNPVDVIDPLQVTALLGSMLTDYGYDQGIESSTFEIMGDFYADTWGYPLAGLMGIDDTTGTSAPYTHKLSLKNSATGQPTKHSLTDSYGATQARAYTAATYSEMAFTFAADKLLTANAKGIALVSAQETVAVPSYSGVLPVPVWNFTLTIGGVATALYVTTLTVTITRANEVIKALTGTQTPAELFAGYMSAKWQGTALADPSDTALDYYLNNTQPSLSITATRGSGATLQSVNLTSTKVAIEDASLKQTGAYLSVDFTGTAQANTTDVGSSAGEGLLTATLENAYPAGTYL